MVYNVFKLCLKRDKNIVPISDIIGGIVGGKIHGLLLANKVKVAYRQTAPFPALNHLRNITFFFFQLKLIIR